MKRIITLFICLLPFCLSIVLGQGISLPPSGGNQKSEVSQYMGLVKVNIKYSSPDVADARGNSRKGQIWGQLVPYGLAPNQFGSAKEIPWRAGANENTVITFSHDVMVQGRSLKAGSYGFHVIPQAEGQAWTLIFNKKTNSWGSYFYDPSEDALRVEANPTGATYHEYLSFEFTDRKLNECTVALMWEDLALPFTIKVENMNDLYINKISNELENIPGYSWQNLNQAAQFCLSNNTHLEKGLEWAQQAVSAPFVGVSNFNTLSTKAMLEAKLEKNDDFVKSIEAAMVQPDATVLQLHQMGRQMINIGKNNEALKVFQTNAEKHPNTWPVNVGLARGHSAVGNYKEALKYAKKAKKNVPEGDSVNKGNVDNLIKMLKKGEDIN
ncbi:MAG: DUF2911 domain-containing protein [Bacteroidia bacterium]|nr:DUF2911 domain-containing protein [Bacteroidia bacterium]